MLLAGRYEPVAELGRGAIGVVQRVRDHAAGGREVALKVLQAEAAASEEVRLQFAQEFRAMAQLRHPNLVEVFDFGWLDAQTRFITMEIVPGRELSALAAEARLPMETVYSLLAQLLQALDFVHSRGYVHRDIKPENIRIRPDGTLKLMDFGLMCQAGRLMAGAQMSGTPSYVAPEVLLGGTLAATTDLYAVGCLTHELLTGHPPFQGNLVEVLRAHVNALPPPLPPAVPSRLRTLVGRLLAKKPAERQASAAEVLVELSTLAGLAPVRTTSAQRQSHLTSTALVGRDAELEVLAALAAAVRGGEARALFVAAPAGVGKTRLLTEFELDAKLGGLRVARAAAHAEGMAPLALLREALGPLAGSAGAEPPPTLAAALRSEQGEAPLSKEELLADTARWLSMLGREQPLLLCLEDLHWADALSIEVLNHVIREALPGIGSLGSYRLDEVPAGHPLGYTLEEGASTLLTLAPFDATGTAALIGAAVRGVSPSVAVTEALHHLTGGNAHYVFEVLRHLHERGVLVQVDGRWRMPADPADLELPPGIAELVAMRLARLDEAARELACRLAVAGQDLPLALVARLGELPEERLLDALDGLIEHQILARTPGGFAFTHARTRDALYAQLPPEACQALHARCGSFWEEPAHRAGVEVLAHHFARAQDAPRAYCYLRQAGVDAEAAGAEATAVACWVEADRFVPSLPLPEPARREEQARLWWDLGFAAFVNQPAVGVHFLERLVALLEAEAAPSEGPGLGPVLHLLGVANGFAGRPRAGLAVVEREMALIGAPGSPAHAAALVSRCSNTLSAGRLDEMVADAREAMAVLEAADLADAPPSVLIARVGAFSAQNLACFAGVRPDPVLRARALAAAALVGDEEPFTVLLPDAVYATFSGRLQEAEAALDRLTQKGRRSGAPPYPWTLYLRPALLDQRGDPEAALAAIAHAARYPHLAETQAAATMLRALEGDVLVTLGRLEAAATTLTAVRAFAEAEGLHLAWFRALVAEGRLARARADGGGARTAFDRAYGLASAGAGRNALHQAMAARMLAELDTAEGHRDAAHARLAEALAIVRRPEQDNPLEQGGCLLAMGELALSAGQADAARQAFGEAEQRFAGLGNAVLAHRAIASAQRQPAARAVEPPRPPQRQSWLGLSSPRTRQD